MPQHTILIIDDNNELRENTAELLSLGGYKTITAENGKKGVSMILNEKPDLVVCDIMMPELDGYGVLHLVRKNPEMENIPFIFLTAKTERGDFRKGMEMGADDYLTKPFEEHELMNAIESRLRKHELLNKKYASSAKGMNELATDLRNNGMLSLDMSQYATESYQKKQTIYTEGKRPRYLYYLVSGKVKGTRVHEDGKEYITDLFSSGDFIGYMALLEGKNYDESAVVLEDAEVLQIPAEDFMEMIYADMSIAAQFIKIIAQNIKEKETRLLSLAYSSLRKRVAKALVEIHDKFNPGKTAAPLEISREDMAHYIGTATESLIRTISDFKSEKLIEIKEGKINITDLERLKNLLY
ncbi:MAG: response regulator [Chitinophagaceae bacterium]|nr:response regulator [Chitinophagaceae bacterium]